MRLCAKCHKAIIVKVVNCTVLESLYRKELNSLFVYATLAVFFV